MDSYRCTPQCFFPLDREDVSLYIVSPEDPRCLSILPATTNRKRKGASVSTPASKSTTAAKRRRTVATRPTTSTQKATPRRAMPIIQHEDTPHVATSGAENLSSYESFLSELLSLTDPTPSSNASAPSAISNISVDSASPSPVQSQYQATSSLDELSSLQGESDPAPTFGLSEADLSEFLFDSSLGESSLDKSSLAIADPSSFLDELITNGGSA